MTGKLPDRETAARGIAEVVIRQVMRKHHDRDLSLDDLRLSRAVAEALRTAGLLK